MEQFESRKFTSEQEIAEARVEMARWYEGVSLVELERYCEGAVWAPGAVEAVAYLQQRNIHVAIASITWKFAVAWFAARLDIANFLGTDLLPSGDIEHVWGHTKGTWLLELAKDFGVEASRIAAVGDSAGDIDLLKAAALRFFVGPEPPDAVPGVIHLPAADIRTIAEHIVHVWRV
jgi:phosphoserine phosphatase